MTDRTHSLTLRSIDAPVTDTAKDTGVRRDLRHGAVVAINKIDRSDARPAEVLDQVYELFIDLGADAHQIDFPVVYTNAKAGTATCALEQPGTDLRPLLDLLVEVTPPPTFQPGHPLQLLVTNLSANEYVGRMAVGRIWNGSIRTGQRL